MALSAAAASASPSFRLIILFSCSRRGAAGPVRHGHTRRSVRETPIATFGAVVTTKSRLNAGEASLQSARCNTKSSAADEPDTARVIRKAGSTPVAFGNGRRGFVVVNKAGAGVGPTILCDPYTRVTAGTIRFHSRMRVGGGVLQPERLVLLRIAAS
jgi:hypothetical protein